MGIADLHIHSVYSFDGSASIQAVMEQASRIAKLDVIAITDHDEIKGAILAQKIAPAYGIQVICGSEITTADGHLIALFIHRSVPGGRPLIESVLRVKEQGGLCIVPHPLAPAVHSVNSRTLAHALSHDEVKEVLVGMETINAGLPWFSQKKNVLRLNNIHHLAPIGSSDSHIFWSIGHGITRFTGNTAEDLRRSLMQKNTRAEFGIERRPFFFYPSFIIRRLLRRLGWITSIPAHNESFVLRPLSEVIE